MSSMFSEPVHQIGHGGPGIHYFGPGGGGVANVNPVAGLLGSAHHSFLASIIAHLLGAAGALPPSHGGFMERAEHVGGQLPSLPTQNAQGLVPSAPDLPAGTYTGAYAAQGLRTSDPAAAAQLWESRHPAAVHHGNIPHWVTQALLHAINSHAPQPKTPTPAPAPSYQAQ